MLAVFRLKVTLCFKCLSFFSQSEVKERFTEMNQILSFLVLSCALIVGPQSTEAYRILGVFPFHGKSHFTMFEALMKGLARKGHQVDVISTFPQKKPYPNYTDIIRVDPQQPQVVNNMSFDLFQFLQNDMTYFIATDMGSKICERLGDPEMVKLIQNPPTDPPYDLVMTEVNGKYTVKKVTKATRTDKIEKSI